MILKIKRKLKEIFREFNIDRKYFSYKLAFIKLINNITYRGSFFRKINKWSLQKRHSEILKYILKKYTYIIEKYQQEDETAENSRKQNLILVGIKGETEVDNSKKDEYSGYLNNQISDLEITGKIVTDDFAPIGN